VLARHLFAIAILPFTVTVLVPLWLARGPIDLSSAIGRSPAEVALQVAGAAVGGAGLLLFGASLRQFATRGQGTLAPWDPPRHLVVEGPYRFVRNPMISGVLLILVAESLILRSWVHASWALVFFGINTVYIPLLEEPQLHARFGDEYAEYRRHVGRLIPRLRPWTAPSVRSPRQERNER
jgi:protein-S-isoprenylcysteine O-methyltransferase Ste14